MTELAGTSRPAGATARLAFLRAFAFLVVAIIGACTRAGVAIDAWNFEREFLHGFARYLDGVEQRAINVADVSVRGGTVS